MGIVHCSLYSHGKNHLTSNQPDNYIITIIAVVAILFGNKYANERNAGRIRNIITLIKFGRQSCYESTGLTDFTADKMHSAVHVIRNVFAVMRCVERGFLVG